MTQGGKTLNRRRDAVMGKADLTDTTETVTLRAHARDTVRNDCITQ